MTPTPEPRPPYADALDTLAATAADNIDAAPARVYVWPRAAYDNGRAVWLLAADDLDPYRAVASAVVEMLAARQEHREPITPAAVAIIANGTATPMTADGTPDHDAAPRRVTLAHMIARDGRHASRVSFHDTDTVEHDETGHGSIADALRDAARALAIIPNPTNN